MTIQKRGLFTLAVALCLFAVPRAHAQDPNNPPAEPQQSSGWRRFGDQRTADAPPPPGELVLPAGTWITVHVNQPLSSDHNQPGDAFTATLAQPLVASGRVIARRGQTVAGRVAEAQKAGHAKG